MLKLLSAMLETFLVLLILMLIICYPSHIILNIVTVELLEVKISFEMTSWILILFNLITLPVATFSNVKDR